MTDQLIDAVIAIADGKGVPFAVLSASNPDTPTISAALESRLP
jgi:hypothetical protein